MKSQSRNISLEDYAKLQNIEDEKERNELLDVLGTNNFNNKYATAIERQKKKKELDEIEEVIKEFAEKSEQEPNYWSSESEYRFVKRFYNKSEITADYSEDERYFYYRSDYSVALYKKKSKEERSAEEEKRMKLEERRLKVEEFRIKAKEISKRMYDLRIDFLQNYVGKSSDSEIITKVILEYAVVENGDYWNFDCFDLMTAIGIVIDEDNECLNFENIYERFPRRVLLAYTMAVIGDNDKLSHIDFYSSEKPYNPSVKLNRIYSLLCKLGYEMSDEEKQLRDGTHSIYMVNKDEEAEDD